MESETIRYVDGKDVRLTRPAGSIHLRAEIRGEQTVLDARVKRAFPMSRPNDYFSIQDGDGKEVAILRSREGLDLESSRRLDEELERRYFTPRIERIDLLKQEAGMWRFAVQTQRGPTEFYVRNWRDSAYEIVPNRWQIFSVDGARFEIPNLEALDAHSQRLMDQLL